LPVNHLNGRHTTSAGKAAFLLTRLAEACGLAQASNCITSVINETGLQNVAALTQDQ
jgi:hypothetical protein